MSYTVFPSELTHTNPRRPTKRNRAWKGEEEDYAMKKPTTISKESVSEYREFVQLRLRKRVLEAIEVVLEEEVDQALGCGS